MEPNDLPIVCIPLDLPDHAAASLVEFFHDLTDALERHYFSQLHRHTQSRRAENREPEHPPVGADPNPPF
jgi:hypothetical protein